MFTTTITMKSDGVRMGPVRTIKTEGYPNLLVNPDGSIFNKDINGVEWKTNWWEVQDIQVEKAAEPTK